MEDLFKTHDTQTAPGAQTPAVHKGITTVFPLKTSTTALSIYGLLTSLWGVERQMGEGLQWHPQNPDQEFFLECFNTYRSRITSWGEILGFEAKATNNVQEMNDFLSSKGFNITLADGGPLAFYIAALSEFIKEWYRKGEMRLFTIGDMGEKFLASSFKCGDGRSHGARAINFSDGKVGLFKYLSIKTEKDLNLAVIVASSEKVTCSPKELTEIAMMHAVEANKPTVNNDIVRFYMPYIKAHVQSDLDFLKGIQYGNAVIHEAKFEMKAIVDRNGYASKTATAIAATRGMLSGDELFITNPIITLVNLGTKDNPLSEPIEVMHVGTDSWVRLGVDDELFRGDEEYITAQQRDVKRIEF